LHLAGLQGLAWQPYPYPLTVIVARRPLTAGRWAVQVPQVLGVAKKHRPLIPVPLPAQHLCITDDHGHGAWTVALLMIMGRGPAAGVAARALLRVTATASGMRQP